MTRHITSDYGLEIESVKNKIDYHFPWDDLRKTFHGCQRVAKIPNAVEKLPKISTG